MEVLNLNNVWGDPEEYKGLTIYPVKMKDILIFNNVVGCLMLEKNKIPDVNIIKMSYLSFLFLSAEIHSELIIGLKMLLNLVLQEPTVECISKNNEVILVLNGVEIDGQDFEKIKDIIFNQNLIITDDMMFDEEIEKRLREAEDFLASKQKPATLEERIFSYGAITHKLYQEIKEMTIYQFNKELERLNLIKNFEVYTYMMLKCGQSDSIAHWLSHIEDKGKYDHLLMDRSEFNKVTEKIK